MQWPTSARTAFANATMAMMLACGQSTGREGPKSGPAPALLQDGSMISIAVAPLSADEADWVGTAIADHLNARLLQTHGVASYTNRQVAAAMHEARVAQANLFNRESARTVGHHLGSRFIVVGNLETFDGRLQGSVWTINTKDGSVQTEVQIDAPQTELAQVAADVANKIGDSLGTPLGGADIAAPLAAIEKTTEAMMILQEQSLSPRSADPLAPIGISSKDLTRATELADLATSDAPGHGDAWTALGLAHAMAGQTEPAWKAFAKTAELDPYGASSTLVRAYAHMREGRFDEAETMLRESVKKHPGFLHGRGSLAELLLHFGRFREARAAFREYLEITPNQPWVLVQLGYCNAKLGHLDDAIKDTERALGLEPTSVFLKTELASRQIDADDLPGAQKTLEGILQIAPNDIRAHVRLGYIKLLLGDDVGSILSSKRALELAKGARHNRDRAYAHLNLARALGHQKRDDEALAHLEKAIAEADVSFDELEIDPALDSLRANPRYENLFQN